jgi:hypothetical protein
MRLLAPLLLVGAVVAGCSSKAAAPGARPHPPPRLARASADPYRASLAYAGCLRRHGVPHPNPDRTGDFKLTAADERRMRAVPKRHRAAATRACFHTLKGLDMRPLSRHGRTRALAVLRQLRRCMQRRGHTLGAPTVRNLSMGRMMFGFERSPRQGSRQRLERDEHACEKQVQLAKKISRIIDDDRSGF